MTTSGFVLPQLKQPTNEVKHAQVNMLNLSCSLVRSLFPLQCIFKRVICLRLQLQSRTRRSTSFGGIHKLQTSSNFSYKIWIILDIICIYIYLQLNESYKLCRICSRPEFMKFCPTTDMFLKYLSTFSTNQN